MKYEKFDIARALAGEPVILRDGTKAYVKYQESELAVRCPILGFDVDGFSHAWDNLGKVIRGTSHSDDIVGMYPKEPLTMPDSFWDMLTPKAVAIAKDENGRWFSYGAVPVLHEIGSWKGWGWKEGHKNRYWNLTAFNPEIFPDCKPEDSLIIRPKEK